MNTRARRTAARLGLLATTLVLAAALIAGSWMNQHAARSAVSTLNRGQADILAAALRAALRGPAEADTTVLRELLDRYGEDAGLRYIGLIDHWRGTTLQVGEPIEPVTLPLQNSDSVPSTMPLMAVGDRVRAILPVPRGRPPLVDRSGRGDPGEPPRGGWTHRPADELPGGEPGPEDRAGDTDVDRGRSATTRDPMNRRVFMFGRRGAPIYLGVLEFEPVVASTLMNGATRSMVLAGVAATLLTLAALLFWRTNERYDRALLRLEEQKRLTVLGEMSAVLAHEMRNPLASLKGHAQLLAERLPSDSRERAKADRVIGEASRLEALTSDLLDFARAGPIELRAIEPAGLMRTSIADVAEDAFELDVSAAPDRWKIDAPRVRQALVNLLENARQASMNGTHGVATAAGDRAPPSQPTGARAKAARARVAQEDGRLVFEVRDSGPGLPAGSEMRIFDPFFTTRTNGTGLGLAVARHVAEMHGGRITAYNHPDGGAVFRLELPRND